MRRTALKVIKFVLRWGIAVGGIWWVVSNTTISDHMRVLDGENRPLSVEVLELPVAGNSAEEPVYTVRDPRGGRPLRVPQSQTVSRPDRAQVTVREDGAEKQVMLLGADIDVREQDGRQVAQAKRLLVADNSKAPGRWVSPAEVVGGYRVQVPHPRVETGLASMVRQANRWLLALSVAIFPVTIILTSIRWRRLMRAVDIEVPLRTALALNMVGMFYNTFIPTGSTGGDVIKAYYVSRHTPHKVRAILTVLVDRVIGLIVLLMLGGTIALGYYLTSDGNDPAAHACARVAMGSGVLLAMLGAGLLVLAHHGLRRALGFNWISARLPMQDFFSKFHETLSMYRKCPRLILWAMLITVPVHLTVMVAAMIAGKALHLPLSSGYYFVVVPVAVLAGALPVSPQGAGVMEFFAIRLTARQGATIAQAFALTLTIRAQQIFWNLLGGIFVLSGHYRAREASEDSDRHDAAQP
jgi:uncharacterized membrane protein YbhN (UPF0104 family)